MTYRILDYSHSDPLYRSLEPNLKVDRGTPSENLKVVLDGEYSESMISLVSYLENREELKLLPTANIHSISTTGSTLLVSSGATIKKSMEISVTANTRTTSHYLSLILRSMGIEYKFRNGEETSADSLLEESDYALVIGDEALKIFGTGHRILLDIGYEFSRIFGRLPVYAVTVSLEDKKSDVTDLVNQSILSYKTHIRECAANASSHLGVPIGIMMWYYKLIRYDFSGPVRSTIDFVEKTLGKPA